MHEFHNMRFYIYKNKNKKPTDVFLSKQFKDQIKPVILLIRRATFMKSTNNFSLIVTDALVKRRVIDETASENWPLLQKPVRFVFIGRVYIQKVTCLFNRPLKADLVTFESIFDKTHGL